MAKQKTLRVKGKTYKRVGTEYSWSRAKTRARQERKHYNVKVVIKKDKTTRPKGRDKKGLTGYGIYERNV